MLAPRTAEASARKSHGPLKRFNGSKSFARLHKRFAFAAGNDGDYESYPFLLLRPHHYEALIALGRDVVADLPVRADAASQDEAVVVAHFASPKPMR
jgi:hypothetical protein